jgi:hypothetical protein
MVGNEKNLGAVLVILGLVVGASAQNASSMSSYQSFMKTASKNLSVGTASVPAFGSTTVVCPATHSAGCTIRVQVSSQFSMDCCMQGNFRIKVSIPGTGSQIWPNSIVNVGMMGSGMMGSGEVFGHTFSFMKSGIPAGASQTVTIQLQTDNGTGTAGYRIASIDCLLN